MLVQAASILCVAGTAPGQNCIISHPQSRHGCLGGSVQLSVSYVASSPSFQWFKNGVAIPGATGSTLTLVNLTAADQAEYRVRVQSPGPFACNQMSEPATVWVNTPPQILDLTGGGQARLGENRVLRVDANVSGPWATYQWFYGNPGTPIPGATSPTLNLGEVDMLEYGMYTVRVTNLCGQVAVTLWLDPSNDAVDQTYIELLKGLIAGEIVRTRYAQDPNPRLIAVLAGIQEITARNPLITAQQLSDFVTAYDQQLAGAFTGDPKLRRPYNLQTAVRFRARVTNIPGLDTDIGAAVLRRLGLDTGGPDRQLQMIAFQNSTGPRLAASDDVAGMLQSLFAGTDASGARNALVIPAASAYLRASGIEPFPTVEQIWQQYPQIAEAVRQLPPSRRHLDAERSANFASVRQRIESAIDSVSAFINAEIAQIESLATQYPTLESTVAASRNTAIVQAAIADRQSDILELSRHRAAASMAAAVMGTGSFQHQQEATVLRHYANTTIWLADSTSDTLSTYFQGVGNILSGVGQLASGGPAGLMGGVGSMTIGVGLLLPEVMPGGGAPSPYQQLSDQITQLQNQVEQIRVAMNDRFNRVDTQLATLYSTMNGGFAAMMQYIQTLSGNVVNIQTTLAQAQSNIQRFEQNLYGILQDGFNFSFVADMNTALGYRNRLQTDLTLTQFGTFEGRFYSAATNDAASNVFAGPDNTLGYDASAIAQLENYPIGYNINNLRTFPQRILGLPSLGTLRAANPTTWALNADTYAQLARENPWYFGQLFSGAPSRLNAVDAAGELAQQVMHAARSTALFDRLLADHATRVSALQANVDTALQQFLVNPGSGSPDISQVNLWGGPTQRPLPTSSFTYPVLNTRMGYYGTFCGTTPGSTISNIGLLDQPHPGTSAAWAILPDEYVLAAYLGLPGRGFNHYCFVVRQAGGSGSAGTWTILPNGTDYAADVDVELWWLANPSSRTFNVQGGSTVTIPGCSEQRQLVVTRRYALRMNSNSWGWVNQPVQAFANRWMNTYTGTIVANPIKGQFFAGQSEDQAWYNGVRVPVWSASTIVNSASLDAVRAEINDRLRAHQSAFLSRIVGALGTGPDVANVRPAADLVSVNARLIDFYLALAAPESMVASDLIRGVLRGSELGLDRTNAMLFYQKALDAIPTTPGAPAPTNRPVIADEMTRRRGLFAPELALALGSSTSEFYPFMKWTLASLDHLRDTALRLAVDDTYVSPPNTTLTVATPVGPAANDAPPARDGLTPRFNPEVLLVTPPVVGSLVLSPSGAFTYTPPPGFQGDVSFTYRLRGDIQPPFQNLVTSDTARVVIRIADCAPIITDQPQHVEFVPGADAAFSVRAGGQGRLSYRWRKDGVDLVEGGRISGVDSPTLVITGMQQSDRGWYDVVVSGACGSVTSSPAGLGACMGDWNGDGVIDFNDFLAFLNDYNAQNPRADLTGDGTIDFNDFLAFLNYFNTPC
jgi:hypothetical protein